MNTRRYNRLGAPLALAAVMALGTGACSGDKPTHHSPTTTQEFTKTAWSDFLIVSSLSPNNKEIKTLEKGTQVQVDCAVLEEGAKPGSGLHTEYHISAPAQYAGYYATARMLEGAEGEPYQPADRKIPECAVPERLVTVQSNI